MKFKIFSFFSGAGFLDLGFEKEGYEVVLVNEFNKEFLHAYQYARKRMNMREPQLGYYCGDINDFLRGDLKKHLKQNIIKIKEDSLVGFIGGPPCPDFSVAGKNMGIDGKNGMLTTSYKRMILEYEPDFFVFENVKGLWSTKKHRLEYEKIKVAFRRKGYVLIDKLVNSLDYGVPQERERVILFGIKSELIDDDKKSAVKKLNEKFEFGETKEYTKINRDRCKWPDTDIFQEDFERQQPVNIIPEITIEYWFRINDVYNHFNSDDFFVPRSVERFYTIDEGDVSKKSFKRLHRWRYSPTAAYGNNEVHLHPYKARRISVAEALAIQSLPKEYVISKELSKSDMFKTIGNGVPYLMSKGLAKSINSFLNAEVKER